MTTKRIIYSRPDGGVSVLVPSPRFVSTFDTETKALAVLIEKDVPDDASGIEIMDVALIPPSREFRDAWEKPAVGSPVVDMSKARQIHAGRIAAAKVAAVSALRKREDFKRLAGDATAADKAAADRAVVEALNFAAIGNQIANAPTPEVLSAVWPPELVEQR